MAESEYDEMFRMDGNETSLKSLITSPSSAPYDLRPRKPGQGMASLEKMVPSSGCIKGSGEEAADSDGRSQGDQVQQRTSLFAEGEELPRATRRSLDFDFTGGVAGFHETSRTDGFRQNRDRMGGESVGEGLEAILQRLQMFEARMNIMERSAVREVPVVRSAGPAIRVSTQPPQYDGSEGWRSYLTRFENCADLAGWDLSTKTKMLGCCMTKSAQKFYAELPLIDRDNYERLTILFGQRFGDGPPESYRTLLASRTRRPKETIHELKDDLWSLVGKAYPGIPYEIQETLTLQAFTRSFPSEVQVFLLGRNTQTLGEAVAAVISYEAVTRKDSWKEPERRVYSLQTSAPMVAPRDKPMPSAPARGPYSCYRCGRRGHIAPECRDPSRGVTCYRCGKVGHIVRTCPQDRSAPSKFQRCKSSGHYPEKCQGNSSSPDQE